MSKWKFLQAFLILCILFVQFLGIAHAANENLVATVYNAKRKVYVPPDWIDPVKFQIKQVIGQFIRWIIGIITGNPVISI